MKQNTCKHKMAQDPLFLNIKGPRQTLIPKPRLRFHPWWLSLLRLQSSKRVEFLGPLMEPEQDDAGHVVFS